MCGICGVVNRDAKAAEAGATFLNDRQSHRGPDDAVTVRIDPFTIGNRRLAIQDPTPQGNQPFRSRSGRFTVVFNGEIYNYIELVERYRLDLGTTCDGAIIPELWEQLGPACLAEFRGMYAIAIADAESRTLTLARDPYGIKPLYMRRLSSVELAFASEPRALAALSSRPAPKPESIAHFLFLGALRADDSPFEGIEAVPPNARVVVDESGALSTHPILTGRDPLVIGDGGPGGDSDLRDVFRTAVDLHLRSDVPTALLLSSGVDSASVAAVARSLGHDLECLTVAGLGAEDETVDARATAQKYGHQHRTVHSELSQQSVGRFFKAMQRPTIDGLNTFIVSHAVREAGYKVALSGLGADEALGGYRHYRLLPYLPWLSRLDRVPTMVTGAAVSMTRRLRPSLRSEKVGRLLHRGGPRTAWSLNLLQREILPPSTVRALTGVDPTTLSGIQPPNHLADSQTFAALVSAELTLYMQSMLLQDADAFSMSASIELRVPFVDRAFFQLANEQRMKRSKVGHKQLLTDALRDPYLAELASRPKRGFALPMDHWLRAGPLRSYREALGEPGAPIWDYVERDAADVVCRSWETTGRWAEVWSLVSLNEWLKSVFD